MTLRTSYIVGLIACTAVGLTSVQIIESAHAETLKITGPNGEVKKQAKRQYGPTTSRDTFWSIAQKVRPSDKVSVYQVMAALYDANPHAFSGNNYNTLERGMILLVPSADVMAAIPNSVAKRRAEQDDRRVSRPTQPRPVVKPIQPPIADIPKKPTAVKSLQIAPQTPAVAVQTKTIKEANAVVVSDLNNTLDEANAKTLMLTDELARSLDELMISNNDNQVQKNKIEQMSLNISSLEEDLQLLQEKYDALSLENKKLLDQTENIEPVAEEPADFWRSLMDNTILLILAASIPLLAIFGLIFWLLSRRSKKAQQSEAETETQAEKALDPAADSDDSDDMVIHLDSNDEESIDDLLDFDSVDLQPEVQMSGDAEMDMASDMFIGEKELEDEEGTSLDDLWAEAMDEQDSDLEPLEDDDDLDSLLAGLDETPTATLTSVAPEDDLDSLLAGLDTDNAAKEANADVDATAENDIDSLLAEFDMPAESNDVAAPVKINDSSSADSSSDDDIDALLAEFDMPAESNDVAEPVNTDGSNSADSSADDIDSLLAEFDMPAESNDVAEPVKTDGSNSTDSSADDHIDSLLAEFDMPAESNDVAEPVEANDSSSADSSAKDDIDSLLAELDMSAKSESDDSNTEFDIDESSASDEDIDELLADLSSIKEESSEDSAQDADHAPLTSGSVDNDDIAALIAAEFQEDVDDDKQADEPSNDDIDALLASLNEPVIDSTTAKNDNELAREEDIVDSDDLAAQIAAELDDGNEIDSINANQSSDEDIDALLASLNEPVVEPQIIDQDKAAIQAQIAAELDIEPANKALISDDEALDDDINALLASFKQDIEDDYTPSTEINLSSSVTDTIEDSKLFDEFDEYLGDIDLTETDDGDNVALRKYAQAEVDGDDDNLAFFDAELEAALTSSFSHDAQSKLTSTATSEPEADDGLDALLAQMDDDQFSSSVKNKITKDSGFFNDLKANKPKVELLDWESDLLNAAESAADEKEIDEPEVSDDDLLAAFSQSLKDDDNDDDYTSEDDYIFSDDNLTVDEALAALDQNERSKSTEYKVIDDDLMCFERENGYIDIDKLLNDADENDDKSDQYKEVNVDMRSVNSLIGNADMVDVDDEENSVNAKLDLARAYIEIEDQDSARALLKEVKMDGNERQQSEAANLLKSFN
jgi:pilus assembly protein FimV